MIEKNTFGELFCKPIPLLQCSSSIIQSPIHNRAYTHTLFFPPYHSSYISLPTIFSFYILYSNPLTQLVLTRRLSPLLPNVKKNLISTNDTFVFYAPDTKRAFSSAEKSSARKYNKQKAAKQQKWFWVCQENTHTRETMADGPAVSTSPTRLCYSLANRQSTISLCTPVMSDCMISHHKILKHNIAPWHARGIRYSFCHS